MEQEKDVFVDENDEIVTLTYDDGEQESFYTLAELDYEGKWYIFLEPIERSEDFSEEDVIIYELGEDEEGEELFLPVEDDDLLDKLIAMFNEELEKE